MAEHPALRLTILTFREKARDESVGQSCGCSTVTINDSTTKVSIFFPLILNFCLNFGFLLRFIGKLAH